MDVTRRMLVCLMLALAAGAAAQAKKPAAKPKLTAAQIMDRGGAALGPRAAWDRIKSSVMEGTLSTKDGSLKGSVTLRAKRPNKFVIRQNVTGVGVTLQGYDGKTGWTKDPMQGLRKLERAELAATRRAALFDAHLQWRKLYKKWELIGTRKVNGRNAYVVRLSPQIGRFTLEYHDTANFRLVRTDMVTETAQGPMPIEVYPSDYRKVDGVLVPYVIRQRMVRPEGPVEVTIRIKSVKNNVTLADSLFAMPKD